MASSVLGRHFRTGLLFMQIIDGFPNDRVAEDGLEQIRLCNAVVHLKCGSRDICTRPDEKRRNQPLRCRSCKSDFSIKTGTLMRRIPETLEDKVKLYARCPVEVNEAFTGGKHKAPKNTGRGVVARTAVVAIKDCETNEITDSVVDKTNADALGLVTENTEESATACIDDARTCNATKCLHENVKHPVSEYADGMAHANGIKSFWPPFRRGYHGIYHHMSRERLHRFVNEFSGRHNLPNNDIIGQMQWIVLKWMANSRLTRS
ncbi:MAG: transposase [Gammaproteobacteria bacterium]|nr:transposase [Gammaproteobacteria bacterium]